MRPRIPSPCASVPAARTRTVRDGIRSMRLKLWCPVRGRLVTWREAAQAPVAAAQPA